MGLDVVRRKHRAFNNGASSTLPSRRERGMNTYSTRVIDTEPVGSPVLHVALWLFCPRFVLYHLLRLAKHTADTERPWPHSAILPSSRTSARRRRRGAERSNSHSHKHPWTGSWWCSRLLYQSHVNRILLLYECVCVWLTGEQMSECATRVRLTVTEISVSGTDSKSVHIPSIL